MDGSRFDALTRSVGSTGSRRRALGGLLVGPLGLLSIQADEAAAKKKRCPPCKKRKKGTCRGTLPDGTACPGGACQGGRCVATVDPLLPPPDDDCPAGLAACGGECRLAEGATCTFHAECCSHHCVLDVCYPSCLGKSCSQEADCCPGVPCFVTAKRCGGCQGPGGTCQSHGACCYSQCNNGFCQSKAGERCATRYDCDGFSACVGGTCTCPTECCSDSDCAIIEVCRDGTCQADNGG